MEIVTAAGAIRLRPETAGDADFRFGLFCLSRALEWAALASALVHSLPRRRPEGMAGRWVLMSRADIGAEKLYRRLGLAEDGGDEVYAQMIWRPPGLFG
ncbi:hypothetical protein K9U39_03205 [Rhodoblastus acidophilus]|uniref:N-acetyltransferase domain-containing protein n=1 Tax=Candidatus Rhodoblastus alkanivorans TaxID=2954117 RepID=A0ABS9Z7K8_9HYPH|nr:hypothetical protein [Candidatus Rhodoblastus alkanivorans]MCI4677611.1 hypothetical protein [Candidatus Rhodoblastus alkanivorans]MCI4682657.1 hypothetical protein [Candidatus Rhodoblastus alkanivorans]MDI4639964.1 hypothetical protein [Rhodoblastus acidophilus]